LGAISGEMSFPERWVAGKTRFSCLLAVDFQDFPLKTIVFHALPPAVAQALKGVCPAIRQRSPSAGRLVCRAMATRFSSVEGDPKSLFFQSLESLFGMPNRF
jgi:hypothetical protein